MPDFRAFAGGTSVARRGGAKGGGSTMLRGLGKAVFALTFAFAIGACDSAPTTLKGTVDPRLHHLAVVASDSACAVPASNESDLAQCLEACASSPSGAGDEACEQSCCTEVTGCTECFVE